ncbi:hypothetical protein PISMIDRAFT_13138 [Pisolithus microcarpus 441]|uniref:Uncharacterized protein n=1 Tax=Pisolithus microcarpus 441 TaxID=765257 RepID=A0A0C9ZJX8_9AGAM|nr:hypothetical protein PISMIDRAFT_13138 [Pisolithus microcarpus 441]
MSSTLPIPLHPWALDGKYDFSGLSATMEYGNVSQPKGNVSSASSGVPVMPSFHTPGMVASLCPVVPPALISEHDPDNTIRNFLDASSNDPWDPSFSPHQATVNWPPSLSSTGEHDFLASDRQASSGALRLPSSTQSASGNAKPVSGSDGSGNGAVGSFTETVEDTDHPALLTEGICDVSTWATRNPGAHIIQPCPSRQMSEAQRASLAIAHEQRATKKALLDKAVQEYLAQQTSKMEEIALKHSVTVEYLKGLVGGQTHYYSSRKVQQHNALLHAKALEVNTGRPCGTKYSLKEIQQMVKDDEHLQNLSQEEMDQYITTLEEHRNTKVRGIRANNVAAAQDVLVTTDKIAKELNGLRDRTGIYATLLVTRGHINDSIQSMWTTTDNSAEFWEDVFGHQVADVARQYEQWACTQNQNLLERDSLGSLRKQITKAISSGLEKVMHKKHIVMNYHNYETAIVETYGVRLVGWPEGMKFTNPSVIGTKLSKNELELFITELNTCRAAGKTVRKTRKKRSDAGTTRKRKAPAGGKENVQLQKKARSSHRRGLPKSAEIISTSDEEDSEDA